MITINFCLVGADVQEKFELQHLKHDWFEKVTET